MSGTGRPAGDGLPLAEFRRLLEICDRFEAGMVAGQAPLIETYLAETLDVPPPTLLRELLTLELEHRSRSGWEPSAEEYLIRFPEHQTVVVSVFAEATFSTIGSGTPPGSIEPESTEAAFDPDAATITQSSAAGPPYAPPGRSKGGAWVEEGAELLPRSIGRYQMEELLGKGGFGCVFKAYDAALDRWVAIKLPHASRIRTERDVNAFFNEARILASLDHYAIVQVFDIGRTDGQCYIVSKLIDGRDLGVRLARRGRPPFRESAALVAAIADAAHHAHSHNLVHRDIKTRNILIDGSGRPYLTDFGLALKEEDFGKGPSFAGTPIYMSPEQARGEGHLVDGRSDVFSLGVVLYELLTGARPFQGKTWEDVIDRIKTQEARPPRQLDGSIPKELERICLKALAKRVSDRYHRALDMADDLRHAQAQIQSAGVQKSSVPPSTSRSGELDASALAMRIVPRGLRCFEAEDADFFLKLLPGPRDREGLPDSLRFWKTRIETTDPGRAFRVGLTYGPSGCGKSSLLRAGLIPRLDATVAALVVEATAADTETRLRTALTRKFDRLPTDAPLAELLAALRRGDVESEPESGKVLIVIDQFEQWLNANRRVEDSELVQAIRQCDGARLQCLLIVRDDFWMSTTRFMQELEVQIVEGENSAAVDLFSARHARTVLAAFGQAYEALPAYPARLSKEQTAFIEQAVEGLSQDGKVVSVQLSLFAEMFKNKEWTIATLKDVGGTQGIGTTFLEETFGAATSPPEYRRHQRAAREVLQALLPDQGAEIKGHMRSWAELLDASGNSADAAAFTELMLILDKELRLITPTDPHGVEADKDHVSEPHYQLTHDYLVPSLRDWLTAKQRETRRGRAELRLSERAALWAAKPERRQLPSFLEWLEIRLHTRRPQWNERSTQMMKAAARHHLVQSSLLLVAAVLAALIGLEGIAYFKAGALVEQLFAAETTKVPEIVPQFASYRRWADPWLRQRKADARLGSQESLHASLALLPVDRGQELELIEELLHARPAHVSIIRDALAPGSPEVKENLWRTLENVGESRERRLRAACALASYDAWNERWSAVAADLASALTSEDLLSIAYWSELLLPVREHLLIPLKNTFLAQSDDQRGYVAASLLAVYAHDRSQLLTELVQNADPRQLQILLSTQKGSSKPKFSTIANRILATRTPAASDEKELDALAKRQANAVLANTAQDQYASLQKALASQPDPRLRTYLIERIPGFGLSPVTLFEQFKHDPTPTVRQAMVLSLGKFDDGQLSHGVRESLTPKLLKLYKNDPDAGVHSAVGWLLSRWRRNDLVHKADGELAKVGPPAQDRQWWIEPHEYTMVRLPGPVEFAMGTPRGQEWNDAFKTDETQHLRLIPRTIAIASKETTVEQFHRLFPEHPYDRNVARGEDSPMIEVDFFAMARYCRLLSEAAGFPEDQNCFPPVNEIKPGFPMRADYLERTGYRPLTEAEWEAACRAGTITPRFYGYDHELLPDYAWSHPHAEMHAHPVGETMPNQLGLFDMLGNVYERCLGPDPRLKFHAKGRVIDDAANVGLPLTISEGQFLVIRGGAFHREPEDIRAACRNGDDTHDPNIRVGFRVARTLKSFPVPTDQAAPTTTRP